MSEFTNKAKGRIKQSVGALTGDRKLEQEGKNDELKGNIEGAVKQTVQKVKTALKNASK